MEKQTKIILITIIALTVLAYIFREDLKKWLKKDKSSTGSTGSTTGSAGTGSTGAGTGNTGSTTGSAGTGSTGAGTGSTGSTTGSAGTGSTSTETVQPKTTEQLINDFYNAFEITEKEADASKAIQEVDALGDADLAKFAIGFYDKYKKNFLKITGITSVFGCGYSSTTCNTIRKVRDRLKVLQGNNTYNPKKYVDAFLL